MRNKIIELRKEGKTYREIAKEVGCSIGSVSRYCGEGQLEKSRLRNREYYIPKKNHKVPLKDTSEKRKERMLQHRYNLTVEEYKALYNGQEEKCKICKDPIKLGGVDGLHIDHDHSTGRVRGLLCRKCNTGLGMFNDNSELLEEAINYLK